MNKQVVVIASIVVAIAIAGILACDTFSSSASSDNQVIVSCDHGHLINSDTGQEYSGGHFGGRITLKYIPDRGYEFVKWNVEGDAHFSSNNNNITIDSIDGTIILSPESRNYSTSNNLVSIIDNPNLPVPGDSVILNWSFSSASLDKTHDPWVGSPSTPLIVGDRVYIHAGNYLYALDITNGAIIKSVPSEVIKNEYYYYVSYGNGIVIDTTGHKAYDLDLNYLFDVPASLKFAVYNDGYFYGCLYDSAGYHMYKTSADPNSDLVDGVKVNLFTNSQSINIYGQYGQFSGFIIKDKWIFYLGAELNGSGRYLYAFNTESEVVLTCDLTDLIGDMLWDDGWLTEYNDYFYVTTYVAGLFDGVSPKLRDKYCSVLWVKFDFEQGCFEAPSCKEIQVENAKFRGITSNFVIYKGHGYINVRSLGTDTTGGSNDIGTSLISFDIADNGEPVVRCAASSAMTHGGIVLNTAFEDEGKLYVYMIPYNPSKCMYVFVDTLIDGNWTLDKKFTRINTDDSRIEYCSQAIRAGPNGEIIYYLDTGYIDCYLPTSKFEIGVITMSETSATINRVTAENIGSAASQVYPQAALVDGKLVLGDRYYLLYALNEVDLSWTRLNNFDVQQYTSKTFDKGVINAYYRYLILLEEGSERHFYDSIDTATGWYYNAGVSYEKCVLYDHSSLDKINTRGIHYLTSKPLVDEVLINSRVVVERESDIIISLPPHVDCSYELSDSRGISVVLNESTLSVHGITESSIVLTMVLDGCSYDILVTVLPKVTVEGDTTTIDSHTEQVTDEGITVTTDLVTQRTCSTQTVDETVVKRDANGNILETVTINETSDDNGDTDEYGNPVKVTERSEIVKDGNDTIVSNISVREERLIISEVDGSTIVVVTNSTLDNLNQVNTIVSETTTSYGSYSVTERTTNVYEGNNSDPVSTSSEFSVVDRSDKSNITVDGSKATIVLSDGSSPNISFVLGMLTQSSKSIVVVSDTSIDGAALEAISDAGAVLSISSGTSSIEMGSATLKNLVGKGDVSLTISDSIGALTPKQTSAAGTAKVFSIELKCGNDQQHDFGTFTLSIACIIEIQDGKELKAWRIDDYGKKTYATNVIYQDGVFSFDADHLSIYAIGYESEPSENPSDSGNNGGNSNVILYAGIGAVAVLALLGAVFVMRRRA